MKNTKNLVVLSDKLKHKYAESSKKGGQYGGKGPFELPSTHKAAMEVTKGGSCCENCKFVDADRHECKNHYYIEWNGDDPKLPDLPLDQICSDWWEPKK